MTNQPPHDKRTLIEPFKIKMVEPLPRLSPEQRRDLLQEAGHNLFLLAAKNVTFDFLTDSGTSAMSSAQWSAMILADESYAGSSSFERFQKQVQDLTGLNHVIPTHQGRAAERLLFSVIAKAGQIVPSNNHFDTTRANLEQLGVEALDLVIAEGKDPKCEHPFKGNMDLDRLEDLCRQNSERIPFGMITITNNSGGGQPVSLENIKGASEIYRRYGIPFFIDICRIAENSYFIQQREPGFRDRKVREIAKETLSWADGCLMSAKKDGLSNIGGFLALREKTWVDQLKAQLILTEGFPTYGGLAARDLEAMTIGLGEALDEDYLAYRTATARYMAHGLERHGIPVLKPAGGHAVYIDAKELLPHIPPSQFPGQALACEMYLREGIRSCEIGSVMFGRGEGSNFSPASMELVRLAFPRRVYTQSHFDFVIEGLAEIAHQKEKIQGLRITWQPPFLRHFTARFARSETNVRDL